MTGNKKKLTDINNGGLGKYFNAETEIGRANVAKATYAAIALLLIYLKFRKPKESKQTTKPQPTESSYNPTKEHLHAYQPKTSPLKINTNSFKEDNNKTVPDSKIVVYQQNPSSNPIKQNVLESESKDNEIKPTKKIIINTTNPDNQNNTTKNTDETESAKLNVHQSQKPEKIKSKPNHQILKSSTTATKIEKSKKTDIVESKHDQIELDEENTKNTTTVKNEKANDAKQKENEINKTKIENRNLKNIGKKTNGINDKDIKNFRTGLHDFDVHDVNLTFANSNNSNQNDLKPKLNNSLDSTNSGSEKSNINFHDIITKNIKLKLRTVEAQPSESLFKPFVNRLHQNMSKSVQLPNTTTSYKSSKSTSKQEYNSITFVNESINHNNDINEYVRNYVGTLRESKLDYDNKMNNTLNRTLKSQSLVNLVKAELLSPCKRE